MSKEEEMDIYYKELVNITSELYSYYDIDKIKMYGVYVWNKADDIDNQENIFDIYADEIQFWTDDKYIIPEALPIIERIQMHIKNGYKKEWFE